MRYQKILGLTRRLKTLVNQIGVKRLVQALIRLVNHQHNYQQLDQALGCLNL